MFTQHSFFYRISMFTCYRIQRTLPSSLEPCISPLILYKTHTKTVAKWQQRSDDTSVHMYKLLQSYIEGNDIGGLLFNIWQGIFLLVFKFDPSSYCLQGMIYDLLLISVLFSRKSQRLLKQHNLKRNYKLNFIEMIDFDWHYYFIIR